MRAFASFVKKELTDALRSGKLLIMLIVFAVFGIMNPAIAKLTPWITELMSDSLADAGMTVTAIEVTAITSWMQFFKNIPMALIIFVLVNSTLFSKEYQSGTLVLVLTRGLPRYKVILAKTLVMLTGWTAGYFICFFVTCGYNAYFWDNAAVTGYWQSALQWYLFGLAVCALTVLFSAVFSSGAGALLGVGGCVLASYLLGMLPALKEFVPTYLAKAAPDPEVGVYSVIITLVLTVAAIAVSIPIFNRKNI